MTDSSPRAAALPTATLADDPPSADQPKVWRRTAGRVVVLDPAHRVLLLHCFDPERPERPWWITPGGGTDPGETTRDAAARELFEETGRRVASAALGEPVRHEFVTFSFAKIPIEQNQDFFALRVDAPFDPIDEHLEPAERETALGHRWWSADELRATDETFYPEELPDLLEAIAAVR